MKRVTWLLAAPFIILIESANGAGACNDLVATGRYEEGIPKCTAEANDGDRHAQSILGYIYVTGRGVQKDLKKAEKWLLLAAAQGDLLSQSNLAYIYSKGPAEMVDIDKAMHWMGKVAATGDTEAELGLGAMLQVREQYKEAAEWLSRAASKKNHIAEYYMARLYHHGLGVAKDEQQSKEYLRRAAAGGHPEAIEDLKRAEMYEK